MSSKTTNDHLFNWKSRYCHQYMPEMLKHAGRRNLLCAECQVAVKQQFIAGIASGSIPGVLSVSSCDTSNFHVIG